MPPLIFDPIYSQLDLPIKHRFPIQKYRGIHDALRANGVASSQFYRPEQVSIELLKDVYQPQYIDELVSGELNAKAMRRIGFPWSQQLITRSLTAVGGTLLTAKLALEQGLALNLTGGYHHAYTDFGSGFCLFNDLYLAARQVLAEPNIDRVLIVDLDVHQGDGTAKLAQGDERIFTCSLHGEKNFPHRKQHSDIDIGFDNFTGDDEYLVTLENILQTAFSIARPDFVIYDAGVDVHEQDDLGRLSLTTQGVLERDTLVLSHCRAYGVPVACVIGGGYQRDNDALVDIHLQLFRAAGVMT